MSDTPRTDREVYKTSKNDVGFDVVNPALCRQLERELAGTKRLAAHFNGLTPAEAERLALLLEEIGEAQQMIGKVLRHGYDSRHPDGGPTNRRLLEKELGDVRHAMIRICAEGDLSKDNIHAAADQKAQSVALYLHHQPERGGA